MGKTAKEVKARRHQATVNVNMASIKRKVIKLTPGGLIIYPNLHSDMKLDNEKSAEVILGRKTEGPNNVLKLANVN